MKEKLYLKKLVFFDEANYAEEYIKASKALNKDEYTKEPVKTSFGYHIILCVSKADKPSLDSIKSKIEDTLLSSVQNEEIEKALIDLRKEYNIKFFDKEYEKEYKEYCEQFDNV